MKRNLFSVFSLVAFFMLTSICFASSSSNDEYTNEASSKVEAAAADEVVLYKTQNDVLRNIAPGAFPGDPGVQLYSTLEVVKIHPEN